MKKFGLIVLAVVVLVGVGIGIGRYFTSSLELHGVDLNADTTSLQRQVGPPYIPVLPPTGDSDTLMGYVGTIVVEKPDGKYEFIGSFRPKRERLKVKPLKEKIYEGLVTSKVKLGGTSSVLSLDLEVDEAAELLVSNDLSISYQEEQEIPWDELQLIPMKPEQRYWFVDSLVLSSVSYKKYRKLKNGTKVEGVAFGVNGEVYHSNKGFKVEQILYLRAFPLRSLLPAQGSSVDEKITQILMNKSAEDSEGSKELLELLHSSTKELPENLPTDWEFEAKPTSSVVRRTTVGYVPILKQEKKTGAGQQSRR